jgi:hypothetical protein
MGLDSSSWFFPTTVRITFELERERALSDLRAGVLAEIRLREN